MSDAPAEPQKTVYQLHAEMRATLAGLERAEAARESAKAAYHKADEAMLAAAAEHGRAVQALLSAPGSMTDHLDALTNAMAPEPLDPVSMLRTLEGRMSRQGDERAALLIGKALAELQYPWFEANYASVRAGGLAKWLARYTDGLAKLAAATAAPPAVEPGLSSE